MVYNCDETQGKIRYAFPDQPSQIPNARQGCDYSPFNEYFETFAENRLFQKGTNSGNLFAYRVKTFSGA